MNKFYIYSARMEKLLGVFTATSDNEALAKLNQRGGYNYTRDDVYVVPAPTY